MFKSQGGQSTTIYPVCALLQNDGTTYALRESLPEVFALEFTVGKNATKSVQLTGKLSEFENKSVFNKILGEALSSYSPSHKFVSRSINVTLYDDNGREFFNQKVPTLWFAVNNHEIVFPPDANSPDGFLCPKILDTTTHVLLCEIKEISKKLNNEKLQLSIIITDNYERIISIKSNAAYIRKYKDDNDLIVDGAYEILFKDPNENMPVQENYTIELQTG